MKKLNITSIDAAFSVILVLSIAILTYSVATEKPLIALDSKNIISKLNPISASYSIKELIACEGSSTINKISDRCFVKVLKNSESVNKKNFSDLVARDLLTLSNQLN